MGWLFAVVLAVVSAMDAGMPLSAASADMPRLFRITLDGGIGHPVSGRLLIFATALADARKHAQGKPIEQVRITSLMPAEGAVAAIELSRLVPGSSVVMDADRMAFPEPFSKLPSGRYAVQAVLDVGHDFNYRGRHDGDIVSKVVTVRFDGNRSSIPTIALSRVLGDPTRAWRLPSHSPQSYKDEEQPILDAARAHSRAIDFVSPALSAFWGLPVHMRGWVLLPPGYAAHPHRRYPTVYFTQGFTGTLATLTYTAGTTWKLMQRGDTPPMIWVFLDESGATGTHEFADSVNNGPWSTALTTELIPKLESVYRMDARPSGRLLTGHSSGGWAALWLQVSHPKMFGGTWPLSPDPVDFSDFMGPDLYAPHANIYRKPDGTPWPQIRVQGRVVGTAEQLAREERVFGPYGGQDASFEWVFSPRGKDGRPAPMFDRDTGAVNPEVVRYWRDHYDIAYRIRTHWKQLRPYLDGKIHLYVGTQDTFYLDRPAHKLKAVLDGLGAHASFHFLLGRTHSVYARGKDRDWLRKVIAWQMYRVARPDARIRAVPGADDDGWHG